MRSAFRGSVMFFAMLLCATTGCTCVPAGNVGVVTTFGAVDEWRVDEGFSFVAPWRSVHEMSVQVQECKETASVPTSEGLAVELEASLLFELRPDAAAAIFQSVGKNYVNVVVESQFRSAMRGTSVKYKAKDLYTSGRAEIEGELRKTTEEALAPYGIDVKAILLRNITLPARVSEAINNKLAADQAAQQMEFVLLKATKEAERVEIEARGIAKAQETIHATLTDSYIRYLWVKALENNAQHPSTVIYVPIGPDGLPLMAAAGKGK